MFRARGTWRLEFDWDEGNREKCQKHGLSVRDIESLFQGQLAAYPDPDHSMEVEIDYYEKEASQIDKRRGG
jgi:hypothetical protein